jgi:hypothetical protein
MDLAQTMNQTKQLELRSIIAHQANTRILSFGQQLATQSRFANASSVPGAQSPFLELLNLDRLLLDHSGQQ